MLKRSLSPDELISCVAVPSVWPLLKPSWFGLSFSSTRPFPINPPVWVLVMACFFVGSATGFDVAAGAGVLVGLEDSGELVGAGVEVGSTVGEGVSVGVGTSVTIGVGVSSGVTV